MVSVLEFWGSSMVERCTVNADVGGPTPPPELWYGVNADIIVCLSAAGGSPPPEPPKGVSFAGVF